jgi:hypothetical protein
MTDKQLLKIVTSFRKGLLGKRGPDLMCLAVSAPLQGLLSGCGIETELICGSIDGILCNHYWLELPNGRIIDATGSQFNYSNPDRIMPEVYIGEKPDWYLIFADQN